MAETRIGIVGYGKIARDQHVPAIMGDPRFRLVGVVAPNGASDISVPVFPDHHAMIAALEMDAVAICTPAGPRHGIARDCLLAGLDVLLEKPPTITLGASEEIAALAASRGRVAFTAWHAQNNPAVDRLRSLLRVEGLRSMEIQWLEDVDKWHPGQRWIWQPGGFGVFDAGINALSIASMVAPTRLIVGSADFLCREGSDQPIAATLTLHGADIAEPVVARFDWRHRQGEKWDISGMTAAGTPFTLSGGGAALTLGDEIWHQPDDAKPEYPAIYARFADLIGARQSLVDLEPLRLVADAFMIARREPQQHKEHNATGGRA